MNYHTALQTSQPASANRLRVPFADLGIAVGFFMWTVVAALTILLLSACNGLPESGNPPSAGETQADVGFTLPYYAAGSALQPLSLTAVEASGRMLVRRTAPDAWEAEYGFALLVEEAGFFVTGEVVLNLLPGTYDLAFLLESQGRVYAARLEQFDVSGGATPLPLVLYPVIEAQSVSAVDVAALARFSLNYDPAIMSGFSDPRFALAVGGGTEYSYRVNPRLTSGNVTVYMPAGSYSFALSFYDGALLTDVVANSTPVVVGPQGGSAEIEVDALPVTTEMTYSHQVSADGSSTTLFYFTVPGVLVNEAGGAGQLEAWLSMAGANTLLVEQALTLFPSGANYVASYTPHNFLPGPVTWALQFYRLGNGRELFAYCAQSVNLTGDGGSASFTFVCEPRLLAADAAGADPVASLQITAQDGQPLAGAVISANDVPVGITGGGAQGLDGTLDVFLPAGTYVLHGSHQTRDPITGAVVTRTAETVVAAAPGEAATAQLAFAALEVAPVPEPTPGPTPAPEIESVVESLSIVAAREARPRRYVDASVELKGPARLRIPTQDALRVLQGDVERYLLVLRLGDVRCYYLGGQWDAAVGGDWEDVFEKAFKSPACNKGHVAGDVIEVSEAIQARVLVGNPAYDITELALEVEVVEWMRP